MGTVAAVLLCILIFLYIELSIYTGCYMYIKAAGKGKQKESDRKQLIGYSVAAGIFFPVTFAIMAAYKAAERK